MKRDKMGREAANNQLIGSYSARLDHSGRLKIPEKFRDLIENSMGRMFLLLLLPTKLSRSIHCQSGKR